MIAFIYLVNIYKIYINMYIFNLKKQIIYLNTYYYRLKKIAPFNGNSLALLRAEIRNPPQIAPRRVFLFPYFQSFHFLNSPQPPPSPSYF